MEATYAKVVKVLLSDNSPVYNVRINNGFDIILDIPCYSETEANALLYAIKINSIIQTA